MRSEENRTKAGRTKEAKKPASRPDMGDYMLNLLGNIKHGKTILELEKDATVFSQGDTAEAIYFIKSGKVKITVVSSTGKEASLVVLGPRGFLGEGCLVGQT